MKRKKLILHFNNPCVENWDEMQANSCGAFCNSCKKNVVDLTNKTNNEIIEFLEQIRAIKPCVKIEKNKADKILYQHINIGKSIWYKLGFTITALFLISKKVHAQRTLKNSHQNLITPDSINSKELNTLISSPKDSSNSKLVKPKKSNIDLMKVEKYINDDVNTLYYEAKYVVNKKDKKVDAILGCPSY